MKPDNPTLRDGRRRCASARGNKSISNTGQNRVNSVVPRTRKISRTLALKCYKLDPSDLVNLQSQDSRVTVRSGNEDVDVVVSLYNEREVEQVAWDKYGGPTQFEHYLLTLREEYMRAHPLGAWEFNSPQHPNRTKRTRTRRIPKPAPAPPPLFSTQPLSSSQPLSPAGKANQPNSNSPNPKFLRPLALRSFGQQPTLDRMNIHHEFIALNCTWLWAAGIRLLAFPFNIPNSAWLHYTPFDKEVALHGLLSLARTYPPRPAMPPPSGSPSWAALRELLACAPSLEHRTHRGAGLSLHESSSSGERRRMWLWDEYYMSELFAALIAVITEHGCGEQGWLSARWEVYDTCFTQLQGLSYRDNRWYDDASDWLKGRMKIPADSALRQDNRSGLGTVYVSLIPEY
ncbi:hypothetical protein B0H12DRAFT_1222848 [Mycena haematopus]|nr:hypothetical protein B0H12DRAFT_1222848 [Mycena haematopus]